jgi:hypothetical protein
MKGFHTKKEIRKAIRYKKLSKKKARRLVDETQWKQYLNYILNVLNGTRGKNDKLARWHLSFGTYLHFIRDKAQQPVPTEDFDVCFFYGEVDPDIVKRNLESFQFKLVDELCDDVKGKPLHLTFKPGNDLVSRVSDKHLDIYFWYRHGKQYYHCYQKERGKFEMKGIDCEKIDGMWKLYWYEDMFPVYVPYAQGGVLDEWYPCWYIRDSKFGVSRTRYSVLLNSFKDWKNEENVKKQIVESKRNYAQFIADMRKRK